MNSEKFYTNQLPKSLNISRTKLYELFKQFGIKPNKEGRKGYINSAQLEQIKGAINPSEVSEHITEKDSIIIQTLKEENAREREELKKELEAEREKNVKIAYQLGQAQTEHQQTKNELLRLKAISQEPEQPKKLWWQIWKK